MLPVEDVDDNVAVVIVCESVCWTMTGLPSSEGCPFSLVAMPVDNLRLSNSELGDVSPGLIGCGT